MHGIAIFNVGPFHGAAAAAAAARREDKKTSLDTLAGRIIVRLSGAGRSDPSRTTTYALEVARFLKFRNRESRCLLHVHEIGNRKKILLQFL